MMVVPNETGLPLGLRIHRNMRFPSVPSLCGCSMMSAMMLKKWRISPCGNLAMEHVLPNLPVRVRAVKSFDSVRVLMTLN